MALFRIAELTRFGSYVQFLGLWVNEHIVAMNHSDGIRAGLGRTLNTSKGRLMRAEHHRVFRWAYI